MSDFSSRDFGKTEAQLSVDLPACLIHRNVLAAPIDDAFSRTRKHPVQIVDVPSRVLSMTIGGLEPGQATGKHRHTYETIILVLQGSGVTYVEERAVEWTAGDAIYIPIWAWHHHVNRSAVQPCRYVACENAPMLQRLGVALRQEEEGPCAS